MDSRALSANGLMIGVVGVNDNGAFINTILPGFKKKGKRVDDFCCVSPRQKSPTLWRVDTTHASVWVEGDQIDIAKDNGLPRDGSVLHNLQKQRNQLLARVNGVSPSGSFPFPSIQGKTVSLIGKLSAFPIELAPVLEKIFLANGAQEVEFVKVS